MLPRPATIRSTFIFGARVSRLEEAVGVRALLYTGDGPLLFDARIKAEDIPRVLPLRDGHQATFRCGFEFNLRCGIRPAPAARHIKVDGYSLTPPNAGVVRTLADRTRPLLWGGMINQSLCSEGASREKQCH
jgi:hypothetical protein